MTDRRSFPVAKLSYPQQGKVPTNVGVEKIDWGHHLEDGIIIALNSDGRLLHLEVTSDKVKVKGSLKSLSKPITLRERARQKIVVSEDKLLFRFPLGKTKDGKTELGERFQLRFQSVSIVEEIVKICTPYFYIHGIEQKKSSQPTQTVANLSQSQSVPQMPSVDQMRSQQSQYASQRSDYQSQSEFKYPDSLPPSLPSQGYKVNGYSQADTVDMESQYQTPANLSQYPASQASLAESQYTRRDVQASSSGSIGQAPPTSSGPYRSMLSEDYDDRTRSEGEVNLEQNCRHMTIPRSSPPSALNDDDIKKVLLRTFPRPEGSESQVQPASAFSTSDPASSRTLRPRNPPLSPPRGEMGSLANADGSSSYVPIIPTPIRIVRPAETPPSALLVDYQQTSTSVEASSVNVNSGPFINEQNSVNAFMTDLIDMNGLTWGQPAQIDDPVDEESEIRLQAFPTLPTGSGSTADAEDVEMQTTFLDEPVNDIIVPDRSLPTTIQPCADQCEDYVHQLPDAEDIIHPFNDRHSYTQWEEGFVPQAMTGKFFEILCERVAQYITSNQLNMDLRNQEVEPVQRQSQDQAQGPSCQCPDCVPPPQPQYQIPVDHCTHCSQQQQQGQDGTHSQAFLQPMEANGYSYSQDLAPWHQGWPEEHSPSLVPREPYTYQYIDYANPEHQYDQHQANNNLNEYDFQASVPSSYAFHG